MKRFGRRLTSISQIGFLVRPKVVTSPSWDLIRGLLPLVQGVPGKSMGIATVELWLAQLLGSFKWVPCGEVDLSETLKLSLEMKNPLVC
ncbi:hypothetical protein YC2023_016983 [Brassica napus]